MLELIFEEQSLAFVLKPNLACFHVVYNLYLDADYSFAFLECIRCWCYGEKTGKPQPELTVLWDRRVLGKKQHCRLTLSIAKFLNKLFLLSLSVNIGVYKQSLPITPSAELPLTFRK